ncbi:hypothetical protein H3C70_00830 [Patescibacteria group bacterium]|nr:hypothetical protein [Patescibacteria group bacterium]
MKFPRGSVLALALLLLLTLSVEQAFTLPVLVTLILLIQQPLLTETESVVLAAVIGLFVAVVYHVPLAVGVGAFVLVTLMSRTVLEKVHVQARDAALTLGLCASLVWFMKTPVTMWGAAAFLAYFLSVIVVLRVWVSRRAFHAKFRI